MPKQEISITTDAVIFSTLSNTDYVLLIQRKNDPFKDEWALPGGFLETDETFETGAKRELKEETGSQTNRSFWSYWQRPKRTNY